TLQTTIANGTTPGTKSIPVSITDAQSRSASTAISLDVNNCGPSPVLISAVYGGGGNAGAPLQNDYIELYNRTNSPVSVTGWSVQYTSASGTTWQTTPLTGTIPANGYFLVQEAPGTSCAGGPCGSPPPTPDATGTIAMSLSSAKVALVGSTTALS